jgi:hypothetical protein
MQHLEALQHGLDAVAAGEGDVREALELKQCVVQHARVLHLRDGDDRNPHWLCARVYLVGVGVW